MSYCLEHSGPPYPSSTHFLDDVTPSFPPTVFVKALADTLLYPSQTSTAYHKLMDLGVETKLIEAEGMLHGDLEGENNILDHPPREKRFWAEVYSVALDWCIERTRVDTDTKTACSPISIKRKLPYTNGQTGEGQRVMGIINA